MSDSKKKTPASETNNAAAEPVDGARKAESSLGVLLTGVRQKRGTSREQVVGETRIPRHYIVMMESDDYALVSDQLYLLPFLRRYAAYLGLDAEEVAMRFVREVQRGETSVVRISEPVVTTRDRRHASRWLVGAIIVVIAATAALYAASHHLMRKMSTPTPTTLSATPPAAIKQPAPPAAVAPKAVPETPLTQAPAVIPAPRAMNSPAATP